MSAIQNRLRDMPKEQYLVQCKKDLQIVFDSTKPVFRHYFFDRSSTAPGWFQRRLAYTRSVAASSMAGYVVGLGDRHTNNMLLLEKTGEVVHIDLGIVFDHGQGLPLPEYVPFRLTRDIVDGMGVTGTDGVFLRCCEETLQVLRENKQALLAVVDVLLHDPLTQWKLSANKKASEQRKGCTSNESVDQAMTGSRGGVPDSDGGAAGGSSRPAELKPAEDKGSAISLDASLVRHGVKEKLEGCITECVAVIRTSRDLKCPHNLSKHPHSCFS